MKKNSDFRVLSHKEERLLNEEERTAYYSELRRYCKNRRLTNTTFAATKIGPILKKPTEAIARAVCKVLAGGEVKIVVDGTENIPEEAVIFASTHQGVMDGFVWIPYCPRHALIFHGKEVNKLLLMAQVNTGLILASKNLNNSEQRRNAKLDLISVLLKGHSVYICPEGLWNLSPNRLHLPITWGFLDAAQKAGKPVLPMCIEYTYDTSGEKERIPFVHLRYGKPITVKEDDNLAEKLEEYMEKISTMRWELIEEKGVFSRCEVSNWDYINYMKGNYKNLDMGKIDVEADTKAIHGVNSDRYQFQHINIVPWDAWGKLLQTEEVERLKRINRVHGI